MAYWWVNQNQTGKQEISGGYLWSPKRNQNGARNQFYENMRIAEAGDTVFSFINGKIGHIGVVQQPAVSASKPLEFGSTGDYWSNEGWAVAVSWRSLAHPVTPKAIIARLRPHLPSRYSPLQDSGDGNQVYLAQIPESMAEVLMAEAGPDILQQRDELKVDVGQASLIDKLDDDIEAAVQNDTTIDETEKVAVSKARRGQGKFRKNLEGIEKQCRVTGVTDRRLLRASHIKPWRSCETNHERLDGNNGFLLAPHIDHLFDQGYICFADDGELLVSSRIAEGQLKRLGISVPRNVGTFNAVQEVYLAFHREHVFRP